MTHPALRCPEGYDQEIAFAYLCDEGESEEQRRFAEHLESTGCEACTQELRSLRFLQEELTGWKPGTNRVDHPLWAMAADAAAHPDPQCSEGYDQEFVFSYLCDGDDGEEQRRFAEHLQSTGCEACAQELRSLRFLQEELNSWQPSTDRADHPLWAMCDDDSDEKRRFAEHLQSTESQRVHESPPPEAKQKDASPWWHVGQQWAAAAAVLVLAVGVSGIEVLHVQRARSDVREVRQIEVPPSVPDASAVARLTPESDAVARVTETAVEVLPLAPSSQGTRQRFGDMMIPPGTRQRFGDITIPPVVDAQLFADRDVVNAPIAYDKLTWFRVFIPEDGDYTIHVRAAVQGLPADGFDPVVPSRVDPVVFLYAVVDEKESLVGYGDDSGDTLDASLSVALDASVLYFVGVGSLYASGIVEVSIATGSVTSPR